MVIAGVHALVYAEDAGAARAFLRDVLGLESVDAHGGWLIFALPPAELAVHPAADSDRASGEHGLFLMCQDLRATVAELERKGVEFKGPVSEEDWGLLATMCVPGAGEMGLYQPTHASPLQAFGAERS